MIFISHRGNINGRNKDKENSPSYIMNALNMGFDVEIDVWFCDNKFYLGHDKPEHEVGYKFLTNEKIWCHGKNLDSIFEMKKYVIHYFWHETDKITLTSKNYVWCFPTNNYPKNSIAVLPEISSGIVLGCKGVCSDVIVNYKEMYG